jgi:hypothetical protein
VGGEQAAGEEQKPGLMQRVWNAVQKFLEEDRKKWGGMTPGAMLRLGLAELREAFSFGGNIAQPTPLGMYGTLTPGEVGEARDTNPRIQQMEQESRMNDNQRLPSPSEIAEGRGVTAREQGNVHSRADAAGSIHGDQKQNLPSPSEIADSQDAQQGQQQNQQQNQSQKHNQNRGRGM